MCFEIGVSDAVQDYQQALKHYEQSADLGYDQAMVNIGYLYYKIATNGAVPFTH
jgi:TPR repeat protein